MLTSEYTTPLKGRPYYSSTGIIKVYDRNNRRYSVGEITLERYDDQNFQYIIKPYWNSIEGLQTGLFQGIPGIDLSLRRNAYYRVNMTPAFISMRTPSEAREDVRQLMESVGLDYYDRFEWLLRSESKCGDDNLMVIRKLLSSNISIKLKDVENGYLNPDNTLKVNSLSDLACSNSSLTQYIYQILQSGVQIYISAEGRYLNENERETMMYLLKNRYNLLLVRGV